MKRRESRFGPPSNPRRVNFYGHFPRGKDAKRHRVNQAHERALIEDAVREALKRVGV